MNNSYPLVSVQWLAENIDQQNLIVLDASLKKSIVKADEKLDGLVLPNAQFFDLDRFSDPDNILPHMMPTAEQFTFEAQKLGINTDSQIVIYDKIGIYTSARVWWMFLSMGFKNVYVLDGGLPTWFAEGLSCKSEYIKPKENGNFIAQYDHSFFVDKNDVLEAIEDKDQTIIDARAEDRYLGKIKEPREGLRSGHIPNAINIPFENLLTQGKLLEAEELVPIFEKVDKNKQIIFSCGSGITACVDALAAKILGYKSISIYDGSWTEWGMDHSLPIASSGK